jgi:hypothetical protein
VILVIGHPDAIRMPTVKCRILGQIEAREPSRVKKLLPNGKFFYTTGSGVRCSGTTMREEDWFAPEEARTPGN